MLQAILIFCAWKCLISPSGTQVLAGQKAYWHSGLPGAPANSRSSCFQLHGADPQCGPATASLTASRSPFLFLLQIYSTRLQTPALLCSNKLNTQVCPPTLKKRRKKKKRCHFKMKYPPIPYFCQPFLITYRPFQTPSCPEGKNVPASSCPKLVSLSWKVLSHPSGCYFFIPPPFHL